MANDPLDFLLKIISIKGTGVPVSKKKIGCGAALGGGANPSWGMVPPIPLVLGSPVQPHTGLYKAITRLKSKVFSLEKL